MTGPTAELVLEKVFKHPEVFANTALHIINDRISVMRGCETPIFVLMETPALYGI